MNQVVKFIFRCLSLVFTLTFFSCGKNIYYDEGQEEQSIPINFKFVGFSSQLLPLQNEMGDYNKLSSSSIVNTQNEVEGYLYYWSFNNDNLLADIRYDKELTPSIAYLNGDIPSSFVNSTYIFDDFAAGRAVTFAGAKEIVIKMPLKNVKDVTKIGFDVGSPGTGPKDFEIFYSLDRGVIYNGLSLVNQFDNTNTANYKHTYTFDFSNKNIKGDELWIKIIPKAGDRGTSGAFNESSGAWRMDNFYLKGIVSSSLNPNESVDKMHYFLFNKDRSKGVISGVKILDKDKTLNLSVPKGQYDIVFLTNDTNEELLIPKDFTVDNFYVSNNFSNYRANIFSYSGELNVNQEKTNQVVLERLFSQVRVDFLDTKGLETITKIVIASVHIPFFYSPFNSNLSSPFVDDSTIEIIDDFELRKYIVFNQFLGRLQNPKVVSYKLYVYGENGLMRTVELSSDLKSNMQLKFRGEILEKSEHANLFSILKNEIWDGEESKDF